MMPIMPRRPYAEKVQQKQYRSRSQRGFTYRRSLMQWDFDMRCDASRSIVRGVASMLMLMLFVRCAAAQGPSDVDACNGGRESKSVEPKIIGCTALINSGLDPQVKAIAYNNRGNAYTTKGEYELAIQDYDESIKLNPNYVKPFNNRGVAYQKKNEYDRAIRDFDAAIKIDPNYADAFANRAETYQKKGDYPSALKDFDVAIQLQPALGVLWNERCWTHAVVGDLQAATTDCNEAIRLEPNDAVAFDSRGFTYLKLGQWKLAIADYDSALRIDPKLPRALYGRGFAKLKTGDRIGGNADIGAAEANEKNIAGEFASYGLR